MLTFKQEINKTRVKTITVKPGIYFCCYEDFNYDKQYCRIQITEKGFQKINVTMGYGVWAISVYTGEQGEDFGFWMKRFFEGDERTTKIRKQMFVDAWNKVKLELDILRS